jgi:hypothetical protein
MIEVLIPVLAMLGFLGLFGYLFYSGNQREKRYRAEIESAAAAQGMTLTPGSGGSGGFDLHHSGTGIAITITRPRKRGNSRSPGATVMRAPLPGWGNDLLIIPTAEERPVLTQGMSQLRQGGMMAGIARAGLSLAFGSELVPFLTRLEPVDSPIGTVMTTLPRLPADLDLTPVDQFLSLPLRGAAPAVIFLGGEVMVRVRGDLDVPGDPALFFSGVIDLVRAIRA